MLFWKPIVLVAFAASLLTTPTLTLANPCATLFAESGANSAFQLYNQIRLETLRDSNEPYVLYANGTKVPLSKAFEKEGLLYSDIALWFPRIDHAAFSARFKARLAAEQSGKAAPRLTRWLQNWATTHRSSNIPVKEVPPEFFSTNWKKRGGTPPSPEAVLEFLLSFENPLDTIRLTSSTELFYDGHLNFDDLRSSDLTPTYLAVGNDGGSYEVKSKGGVIDLRQYRKQRELVEEGLDGKVGHEHNVHAWPENAAERAAMAPQYIGLLDQTTWYLFWRSTAKDPGDYDSLIDHPYLGVYSRPQLDRLHNAVVTGDVKRFNDKYRMIGARRVKGDPNLPGQNENILLPDWEARAGKKVRDFINEMLAARFATGDFRGIKDYRSAERFDASAPIEQIAGPFVSPADLVVLKKFEQEYRMMHWSPSKLARNHFRNKILSPLLPWELQVQVSIGTPALHDAQRTYARTLVKVARRYLEDKSTAEANETTLDKGERNAEALDKIKQAVYEFSQVAQLDRDFRRAIEPKAGTIPDIEVPFAGPINPNTVNLGIEYSFRFPTDVQTRAQAEDYISRAAESVRQKLGGTKVERMPDGGHGHGLSIRYVVTDSQGRPWRVEWDGVNRSYRDGSAYWARGGHIEVPTPKFIPQMWEVTALYEAMAAVKCYPKRSAGGAHANVDVQPFEDLGPHIGARKMANLIAFTESHREMTWFLWQHPYRRNAAAPIEVTRELQYKLNEFQGDWQDLGSLLYGLGYFNRLIGRKPVYTQLNVVSLFIDFVPETYKKSHDMRNPERRWFPSFGGKGKGRVEYRGFDAPENTYMAALQLKYLRALLNTALNTQGVIPLHDVYGGSRVRELWLNQPSRFISDAEAHFIMLGLDPKEFAPLIRDAFTVQEVTPRAREWKTKEEFQKTVEEESPN